MSECFKIARTVVGDKDRNRKCMRQESNVGLIDGKDVLWQYTNVRQRCCCRCSHRCLQEQICCRPREQVSFDWDHSNKRLLYCRYLSLSLHSDLERWPSRWLRWAILVRSWQSPSCDNIAKYLMACGANQKYWEYSCEAVVVLSSNREMQETWEQRLLGLVA